ncbi:MAG: U32 family peptidase [Clostridiales bacterium]|nr:U32 family peptidase [Clostridiales bacterium]
MINVRKPPELLSPAGNADKLRAAILYGANAVYLAGDDFGMRAAADNFSLDELAEAVKYAHDHGVRVNLTLNTTPHSDEYPKLESFVKSIADFGIDAVIAVDLGVISLVREYMPTAELHVSTQASTVSAAACREWHRLGAKRVVLARELTLDEIRFIRANTPPELELETFIHGSMCISYSGRCLLSQHFVGRDANRGRCAQPCRWNMTYSKAGEMACGDSCTSSADEGCAEYEIVEEKRPDNRVPVIENERGTFFLSSKDMCMIEHIPELIEAGIDCFKIEGRMKSEYYAAVVTNAYRMAIDRYLADPEGYKYDPAWLRELESVSHREYNTGYYFAKPMEDANTAKNPGYMKEKAYLCRVESYDSTTGRALLIQRNKVFANSNVEVISPGKVGRAFNIGELYDEQSNVIESAPHPYMRFYAKLPFEVKAGDIIRAGN